MATGLSKVSLNAFFDNFVLFFVCFPCNAIVGAKKIASVVASEIFLLDGQTAIYLFGGSIIASKHCPLSCTD
jgi:hypothetical protein